MLGIDKDEFKNKTHFLKRFLELGAFEYWKAQILEISMEWQFPGFSRGCDTSDNIHANTPTHLRRFSCLFLFFDVKTVYNFLFRLYFMIIKKHSLFELAKIKNYSSIGYLNIFVNPKPAETKI